MTELGDWELADLCLSLGLTSPRVVSPFSEKRQLSLGDMTYLYS